jgi:aryl-alcohol dehydrogenase-like predicted oxidoreductase
MELQHAGFGPRLLGRTGLTVGAMGISASYGVPAAAVERAFEHGVNYLYWGSIRRRAFADAIRNLAPHRDRMVLVLQSYSRVSRIMTHGVEKALRQLRMDRADVLLLGWWNHQIPERLLDTARALEGRGLVRFLAVSTHARPLAPVLARMPDIDILHVRYNAAHPGAERDIFPHLAPECPAGIVAFTATSWGKLLKPGRVPPGERVPTAADCYRFVLSNPAVHLCMSGPARAEHVDAVLEAMARGPMADEEMAWMRRAGGFKSS